MQPYVNIHTHHLSRDNGVFVFNNRLGYTNPIHTQTYFSIGIHPWDIDHITTESVETIETLLKHPNCLAIGECGLDNLIDIPIAQQTLYFEKQLALAVKYNKPVIIHCVKAFDELIKVTQAFTNLKLVIHGFNKSSEMAGQLIAKGFYLSLNPAVFKKDNVDLSGLPLQKLFLETDDKQDLSIQTVYKAAAIKLSVTEDELKTKIYHNFAAVFL